MNMNEMVVVESSNIAAVGYDENKLYVEYKSGALYSYENVARNVYEDLLQAPSKGKFINENVKSKYNYKRED